jgi:hypothetical protein
MTTDEAKTILADLERRKQEHEAKLRLADADIGSISLAAQTGDAEARKRLAKLQGEKRSAEDELKSLVFAGEAQRRVVAECEAADTEEAERKNAGKALAMLDSFAARGAALDKTFDAALAEYAELTKDFHALTSLGYAPTTYPALKVAMQKAAATKLMFTDLQGAFLAPRERRNFKDAVEWFARNIRVKAEARLNRNKTAKAA